MSPKLLLCAAVIAPEATFFLSLLHPPAGSAAGEKGKYVARTLLCNLETQARKHQTPSRNYVIPMNCREFS